MTWSGASGNTQPVRIIGQGLTQQVTVCDATPISAVTPRRFMRLQVTHP